MTDRTGIFGPNRKGLAQGLYWNRIKKDAMKLSAPFDLLEIDLNNEEILRHENSNSRNVIPLKRVWKLKRS